MLILAEVGAKSSGSGFLQIITIALLFVLIFAGAYWTTHLIGKYQMQQNGRRNLAIIEAISVGPAKSLQIVKVGSEYVLIGVSKDQISHIRTLSAEQLDLSKIQAADAVVPFSKYLDKFQKKDRS